MTTKTATKIRTVGDVRDEKMMIEAAEYAASERRYKAEQERLQYIQARLREYPQIGTLNSGKFYAFVGPTRQYFESLFLSAVIDAIEDAK